MKILLLTSGEILVGDLAGQSDCVCRLMCWLGMLTVTVMTWSYPLTMLINLLGVKICYEREYYKREMRNFSGYPKRKERLNSNSMLRLQYNLMLMPCLPLTVYLLNGIGEGFGNLSAEVPVLHQPNSWDPGTGDKVGGGLLHGNGMGWGRPETRQWRGMELAAHD